MDRKSVNSVWCHWTEKSFRKDVNNQVKPSANGQLCENKKYTSDKMKKWMKSLSLPRGWFLFYFIFFNILRAALILINLSLTNTVHLIIMIKRWWKICSTSWARGSADWKVGCSIPGCSSLIAKYPWERPQVGSDVFIGVWIIGRKHLRMYE